MSIRTVVFTAIVVSLLYACIAGPPARMGAPVCTTHECHIAIAVANCQIAADPSVIRIGAANRNVELHWDITTPGFAFSDEGIVFNDDPGREFQNPAKPQPTKFIVHDRHSSAGDFKYTINIRASSACPALTLDPWVVND